MAKRLSPGERGSQAQSRKIAAADTGRDKSDPGHDVGWPHYNQRGNCMCFCKRCFGVAGCICRSCAGIGHENCHMAQKAA